MDTAEWRRFDEPAAVTDIDEDDSPPRSRLALARHHWRSYVNRHGRRGSVIGLGITFVLLLASQWMPWANIVPQANPTTSFDANGNPTSTVELLGNGTYNVGINDANTAMTLTYYLMWVIVLALAGATVFASRRVRQPLFGATIGAIVVQFVAIVPLLRHPRGLIVNAISDIAAGTEATELVVTRGSGMFCAVAALVVLAGAMVFAVQGNVLPSLASDDENEAFDGTPEFEPDIPDADLDVDMLDVDIEVLPEPPATLDGRHSVPPAIDTAHEPAMQPDVVAFTVEAVEGLPEHPDVPAPPPVADHSAYARPLGNDKYRP
jgi:hypothetical protein